MKSLATKKTDIPSMKMRLLNVHEIKCVETGLSNFSSIACGAFVKFK